MVHTELDELELIEREVALEKVASIVRSKSLGIEDLFELFPEDIRRTFLTSASQETNAYDPFFS